MAYARRTHQQDHQRLSWFKQMYWAGIVIATVLALLEIPLSKSENQTSLSEMPSLLGIVHLFVLIIVGWFYYRKCGRETESFFATEAGNRIQSAGYLHTLIGFISAVALLGQGAGFRVDQLTSPLGGALATSVLGWLLGGELSALGDNKDLGLEDAVRKVVSNLERYANSLEHIHSKHTNQLEDNYKGHTARMIAFNKNYEAKLKGIEEEINASAKSIPKSLVGLSKKIDQEQEQLSISLSGLNSTVDRQTADLDTQLQAYLTASAKVTDNAGSIANDFTMLGRSSQKASAELTETIGSMRTVSRSLLECAETSRATVSATNKLLREMQKEAEGTLVMSRRNN